MTYLFKLAGRLARSWRVGVSLVLAAACSPTEERDFLSPNPGSPNQLISVSVSPRLGSARPGERIQFTATGVGTSGSMPVEVDWTATGGTIGADGGFVSDRLGFFQVAVRVKAAPHVRDSVTVAVYQSPQDVVLVQVSPDTATVFEGEGLQLAAVARLGDGTTTGQAPLDWSATGGTVDGSGWYAAPSEGTYLIEARASSDISASSKITVRKNRMLTGLVVTPDGVTVPAGGTQQFAAQARYSDGGAGSVTVTWSATGGTIGGNGQFTAGSASGNYQVIARAKSGGFADTAFISIAAPTIAGVEISPTDLSLAPTATQQYVATARMSDGTTRTVGATWRATGGTISAGGLYTAPSATGTYRVVGEVSGTSYADTSSVAVGTPEATLTQLILNPSSASVPAGAGRQFSVSGVYSDGTTRTPSVTWSATGGTISTGGLFVAGGTQGAYRVIAIDPVSGRADTSAVTVGAPVVTSLALSPSDFGLESGQSRQLAVSGTWSDGSTAAPVVTWSATGGTVGVNGLYTAGPATGTYRVIAQEAGGLADTAYATISQPDVALASLTVSPGATSVQAGGSKQFTASGTYADGSTGNPAVTWSATGGTISASGFYTASGSAGSFRVIATQSGGGLVDTAEVTVTAPPSLVSLAISPGSVGLGAGQTQQFTVSGTYSNGSTGAPAVTWRATGGTISSSGLYTAGQFGGAFLVIANCGCGIEDTAEIALAAVAQPTLQAIELSPSSVSLSPGASQTFQVVGRLSDGSAAQVDVQYSFSGGTMAGNTYTAESVAGTYLVVARVVGGTMSDTTSVTVATQSPSSSEPPGFTKISERGFNAIQEDGWGFYGGSLSIQQDAGAPKSASYVARALFPAGFVGGAGPISTEKSLGRNSTRLYVSFWLKYSPNWVGHPSSGVNKIFHLWVGGSNRAYLSAQGKDGAPLQPQIRLQRMAVGGAINLTPNLQSAEIVRGRWYRWEFILKSNTPGLADGSAEWWIDGQKVGHYLGLGFVAVGTSNVWETLSWNPTWGGVGDTVPSDQWMAIDHIYISKAP